MYLRILNLKINLDTNSHKFAIFLDISKTFDRVLHRRLISKLSSLKLDSITQSWIPNFRSLRSQITVNGDFQPKISNATLGVSQGTVLGPLLFLVYNNDVPTSLSTSILLVPYNGMFYRKISHQDDHLLLQLDFDITHTRGDKWLIPLIPSKGKLLNFTGK